MSFVRKYEKLAGDGNRLFPQMLVDVLTQTVTPAIVPDMLAEVPAEGRYNPLPTGSKRKPRAAAVAKDPEVYPRPNGQEYHARPWGKGTTQDVQVLRQARSATIAAYAVGGSGSAMFPLLYGAPGCGKTALIEAAYGTDVITLMGTGDIETGDLEGGYVQTPSGGFEWIDGGFVEALENGLVYFIDEIGLIDPKVMSLVYSVMDGRGEYTVTANPERGTIKAHPNFFVVAATNPNAPGVRLSEALLSRFTIQAEMTTDWTLAKKLGVSASMVTCASNLQTKVQSGEVSWAPQMRELLAFRDISALFGQDWAIGNLIAIAPEMDRPVVAKTFSLAFGKDIKPARI